MYTIYYILSQIPDHSSKNASQAAASSSRRSCSTCSSIASSGLSRTSTMPKEGRNGGALLARALQRKRNADRISFSALAGASLQRLMLRTLPAILNARSFVAVADMSERIFRITTIRFGIVDATA